MVGIKLVALLTINLGQPMTIEAAQAQSSATQSRDATVSAAVRKSVGEAQKALAAEDYAAVEKSLAAAEVASTNNTERYFVSSVNLQLQMAKFSADQKASPARSPDRRALIKSLDTLIANPATPADVLSKLNRVRSQLGAKSAMSGGAAVSAGNAPDEALAIAETKLENGDLQSGLDALDAAIQKKTAQGQKVPEEYYRFAIAKTASANMRPEAVYWLKRYASAYPTPKAWANIATVYALSQNALTKLSENEKLDVWRLLREAKALRSADDYLEYGDLALRQMMSGEGIAVLQEGQTSGKLTGNATANGLIRGGQAALSREAASTPDMTQIKSSANGRLALAAGDTHLMQSPLASADLYRLALQKGGVDNDAVNTHLGIALARSGDKSGARAAFSAVTYGARREIAQFWLTWLDTGSAR